MLSNQPNLTGQLYSVSTHQPQDIVFTFIFETTSFCVAQAGLEQETLTLCLLDAGIIGMSTIPSSQYLFLKWAPYICHCLSKSIQRFLLDLRIKFKLVSFA